MYIYISIYLHICVMVLIGSMVSKAELILNIKRTLPLFIFIASLPLFIFSNNF